MKNIAFTAIAAVLGACSTTTPNSATTNAAGDYAVVQNGSTYIL